MLVGLNDQLSDGSIECNQNKHDKSLAHSSDVINYFKVVGVYMATSGHGHTHSIGAICVHPFQNQFTCHACGNNTSSSNISPKEKVYMSEANYLYISFIRGGYE